MATTIRAQRLIEAKNQLEKSKTLSSKISALRELLAVPNLGRDYRRFAEKKLIEFRSEATAAGNEELLRRLDLLDQRLVVHVESERSRLARKHGGRLKTSKKAVPVITPVQVNPGPSDDLMKLWKGEGQ